MVTTLRITGMTCNRCVNHVGEALRALPGVTQATVDLAQGTARIDHDHATQSEAALRAAVAAAGYETAP